MPVSSTYIPYVGGTPIGQPTIAQKKATAANEFMMKKKPPGWMRREMWEQAYGHKIGSPTASPSRSGSPSATRMSARQLNQQRVAGLYGVPEQSTSQVRPVPPTGGNEGAIATQPVPPIGGQPVPPAPGAEQPNGPMGIPAWADDYQKAYDEAKAANEARYGEGLGMLQDLYGRSMDRTSQLGEAQRAEAEDMARRRGAVAGGNLVSRGMGNTTLVNTAQQGVNRERDRRMLEIDDAVNRQQLQTDIGLTQGITGWMGDRTDTYPDMGQFAALAGAYGEGGQAYGGFDPNDPLAGGMPGAPRHHASWYSTACRRAAYSRSTRWSSCTNGSGQSIHA